MMIDTRIMEELNPEQIQEIEQMEPEERKRFMDEMTHIQNVRDYYKRKDELLPMDDLTRIFEKHEWDYINEHTKVQKKVLSNIYDFARDGVTKKLLVQEKPITKRRWNEIKFMVETCDPERDTFFEDVSGFEPKRLWTKIAIEQLSKRKTIFFVDTDPAAAERITITFTSSRN